MDTLKRCSVNVMVSNLEAAVKFYSETLGLELVQQYGDHYAEIQAQGLMIGLHPASGKITPGNNLSVGFGVVDFDLTMKKLKSRGIEFKITQEGPIRLAHFTDPDKNQLFLAEHN